MPLSAQTAGKREREENQNGRYCDEKKRFSTLWANAIAPLQVHPSCTNGIDLDSSHMHILQFLVVFVFALVVVVVVVVVLHVVVCASLSSS